MLSFSVVFVGKIERKKQENMRDLEKKKLQKIAKKLHVKNNKIQQLLFFCLRFNAYYVRYIEIDD